MGNLDSFVTTAREFSAWCVSPSTDEEREARRALSLLLRLYSIAPELRFPDNMGYDLDDAGPTTRRGKRSASAPLPFRSTITLQSLTHKLSLQEIRWSAAWPTTLLTSTRTCLRTCLCTDRVMLQRPNGYS